MSPVGHLPWCSLRSNEPQGSSLRKGFCIRNVPTCLPFLNVTLSLALWKTTAVWGAGWVLTMMSLSVVNARGSPHPQWYHQILLLIFTENVLHARCRFESSSSMESFHPHTTTLRSGCCYYGLNVCVALKLYVEALTTPSVALFGDGASREV